MYLYHYFDLSTGPFRSLSDLSTDEACAVLDTIKAQKPRSMSARRDAAYIENRRRTEGIIRETFAAKGGLISRTSPHYMTVGHCPWLYSWYENPDFLVIPVTEFDIHTLSFTYGDSMPTFSPRVTDGREYRRRLYTYPEILDIIDRYGYPQDWNSSGKFGPERYIEVHVWSDEVIRRYRA